MKSATPLESILVSLGGAESSIVEILARILVPPADYAPFPRPTDPDGWDRLPAKSRKRLVKFGEDALDGSWPLLLAARYLDFARNGNRSKYSTSYFERRRRLGALLLAECCENRGRFVDEIINGVWLICEESSWCVPAHVGVQSAGVGLPDTAEPTVDLFAAETGALLAWLRYLLGPNLDAQSPLVSDRIAREIGSRILDPCFARDDFWWMGFGPRKINNWNPWINSNRLACLLLVETDPARRAEAVAKSVRSVDRFLGTYPADGGCDEGPSYWGRAGASLFDYLELLSEATQGRFDPFGLEIVADIGRFICRVHIAGDQFVNFADAPAVLSPPGALVRRYGRRVGDGDLADFGAWLMQRQSGSTHDVGLTGSPGRVLAELFPTPETSGAAGFGRTNRKGPTVGGGVSRPADSTAGAAVARAPLPRETWFPVIEVMIARDHAGATDGFFVAAKGGHNGESHNHNDVGSLIVYRDGDPVLIDVGVETYSRKTFSEERYAIWTMQSKYHNFLPSVDGTMQAAGVEFAASDVRYEATDDAVEFSLDISGAYPRDPGIEVWNRTVRLVRGSRVDVVDRFELRGGPATIELGAMTPCTVLDGGDGRLCFSGAALPAGRKAGGAVLDYDADLFEAGVEDMDVEDEKLAAVWGARLRRVSFVSKHPVSAGRLRFSISV